MPIDFDHIRKCKRGQPTGREVFGLPLVICPSWEEVESLEGQGALPVHVDEAELMHKSDLIGPGDKQFILKLKTLMNGVRLVKIVRNKNVGAQEEQAS